MVCWRWLEEVDIFKLNGLKFELNFVWCVDICYDIDCLLLDNLLYNFEV